MLRSTLENSRLTANGRFAQVCGHALRLVALSLALISYGAVPSSTIAGQSEVELQIQEEFASQHSFDIRHRLRGAAMRRAGFAIVVAPTKASTASVRGTELLSQRLSLGLSLPLRC